MSKLYYISFQIKEYHGNQIFGVKDDLTLDDINIWKEAILKEYGESADVARGTNREAVTITSITQISRLHRV